LINNCEFFFKISEFLSVMPFLLLVHSYATDHKHTNALHTLITREH